MVAAGKFFKEKRWAILAILLGVVLGFGSALICIAWNLVIFGFNIMYIVSPLLAGFVETFIASRKYGKSTGAISALLTFLLINGYGWFGPGWIFPKEPVTLSLITIIAIILTIQAAFPTFVNHILLVVLPGIFSRFMGLLVRTPSEIIQATSPETGRDKQADEIFLDELTLPLVSVPDVNGEKIKSYVGLVTGQAIAEEKRSEGRFSSIVKIIEPVQLENFNLGNAKKLAFSRMLENAESMGANGVVEVLIDFVSMGGLQGSVTIVTAIGTAVVFNDEIKLDENRFDEDNGYVEDIGREKIRENTHNAVEKVSNDNVMVKKDFGGINEEISDNIGGDDISNEISQFVKEETDKLNRNLELATKSYLDQELEMRFLKVSKDFEGLRGSSIEIKGDQRENKRENHWERSGRY